MDEYAVKTEIVQSDTPRLTMEVEKLSKEIEVAFVRSQKLAERLERLLVPSSVDRESSDLNAVPMREPSALTRSVIGCGESVRRISTLVDDLLERLEV